MEIKVLGCYGGMDFEYHLTSFLIDNSFAIDAGAITDALSFREQVAITDLLITHSHMDHTSALPFLIDNIYGNQKRPLRIYGHCEVLRNIRQHIFNEVSWPNFTRIPSPENPTIEYVELPVGETHEVNGYEVTPVWVNHIVPTTGLIVTSEGRSWINSSDTADTDELWRRVNDLPDPRLLFLECSFPNRFAELADASKHLTPAGVGRQLAKLKREFPVRVYHAKPNYLDEILEELHQLKHPDLKLLEQGKTYKI